MPFSGTQSDTDEEKTSHEIIDDATSLNMNTEQTLLEVKKIMQSTTTISDGKIFNLFSELQDSLEKKLTAEKVLNLKQTSIQSFFKKF